MSATGAFNVNDLTWKTVYLRTGMTQNRTPFNVPKIL